LVHTVVSETYVKFGGIIFKQVCGIPMGGSASPMIADLTLAALEFDYLKKSGNADISRTVTNAFRYIDDLLLVTTDNYENILKQIYPVELIYTRTNTSDQKCDFLDLAITRDTKYSFKVYDKTVDFSFAVNKFVYADSNVSSTIGYDVFYAQLVRHARITTIVSEFLDKAKSMHSVLLKHGFARHKLVLTFVRFGCHHRVLLYKYGVSSKVHLLRMIKYIFL